MSREYFSSDPSRPFADAVLIDGKTLYLSGRLGLIPGTDKVPESVEEEAHAVMQEGRGLNCRGSPSRISFRRYEEHGALAS